MGGKDKPKDELAEKREQSKQAKAKAKEHYDKLAKEVEEEK